MAERTIIGATAERIVAGSRNPVIASTTTVPRSSPRLAGPIAAITGTDAIAAIPPATNAGPISVSAPTRSARRPPAQAPRAIPARITPMIPVQVWSVTPT